MKRLLAPILTVVFLLALGAPAMAETQTPVAGSVKVNGLSCPFCAAGLQKKIDKLSWIQAVKVYVDDGRADFKVKQGKTPNVKALRKAVRSAGFTPKSVTLVTRGTLSIDGAGVALIANGARLVLEPGAKRDALVKAAGSGKRVVQVVGLATTSVANKISTTAIAISSYRVM